MVCSLGSLLSESEAVEPPLTDLLLLSTSEPSLDLAPKLQVLSCTNFDLRLTLFKLLMKNLDTENIFILIIISN
jgi:hypothetical protein